MRMPYVRTSVDQNANLRVPVVGSKPSLVILKAYKVRYGASCAVWWLWAPGTDVVLQNGYRTGVI